MVNPGPLAMSETHGRYHDLITEMVPVVGHVTKTVGRAARMVGIRSTAAGLDKVPRLALACRGVAAWVVR